MHCLLKTGIITTSQPQQFRQFQLVTNAGSGSGSGGGQQISNQTTTQIVSIPSGQSNTGGGQGQSGQGQTTTTTIRKVGSSSNLAGLQQKVQVLNRSGGSIQIVQSGNPASRLTNPANNKSTISTTQLPSQSIQIVQQQGSSKPSNSQNS